MVKQDISQHILTIGPKFLPPRGGIASVLYTYNDHVFHPMKFVGTVGDGSKLSKLWDFISAFFLTVRYLFFGRKIKIVHIHTASYLSFYRASVFWCLSKIARRKVIMHMHSGYFKDYYQKHPKFVKYVLRRSDQLIALSPVWKEFYENEVGAKHVVVIPNIIAPPVEMKMNNDGKLHILFLGLFKKDKGFFDLLDAMISLRDKLDGKVVLHLCGRQNENQAKEIIETNGLQEMVKIEGWISGVTKVELLNKCSLFVLPSYFEGVPISILESMSYGMAIISTKVGGIPSIVENGVNGFLIEPGDVKGLADNILLLSEDKLTLSNMGEESVLKVKDYLPETICRQLTSIYQQLLN